MKRGLGPEATIHHHLETADWKQKALIDRELGDRRSEGTDLWNMSLALDQLGERREAIRHAEQAITIYEQIEDPYAAKVRAKLATWREQTDT
ncbi:MAG TPA: hypothetical protein VLB46_16920 [Pyrinomonadaceae bacterium]|nr:hypothetical protein [Pyrinomonadaceae bacterium]